MPIGASFKIEFPNSLFTDYLIRLHAYQTAWLPYQTAWLPYQTAWLPYQAAWLPYQTALLPYQTAWHIPERFKVSNSNLAGLT